MSLIHLIAYGLLFGSIICACIGLLMGAGYVLYCKAMDAATGHPWAKWWRP